MYGVFFLHFIFNGVSDDFAYLIKMQLHHIASGSVVLCFTGLINVRRKLYTFLSPLLAYLPNLYRKSLQPTNRKYRQQHPHPHSHPSGFLTDLLRTSSRSSSLVKYKSLLKYSVICPAADSLQTFQIRL